MNNVAPPLVQVPLATFLGLYTEASPEDLPEGASPQCWDVDFVVGSVKMRPGIASAYSFSGENTGPNNAGLGADLPQGNCVWQNPNNITVGGSGYATVTVPQSPLLFSDALRADHFGFALPSQSVNGIEIGITGHQVGTGTISVQLVKNGVGLGALKTITLSAGDTRVVLGSSTDTWAAGLTPADINNVLFGANIFASGNASFSLDLVDCKIYQVASNNNFNWIKSYRRQDGGLFTLALDSNGVLWQEDVLNQPNILNSIYTGIRPNSFAKGITFDDVEYIDINDLNAGSDMPRQWDGENLDRISQVGPGVAPAVGTTSTTYPIVASPNGITQPTLKSDTTFPGHLSGILWSAGPGSTAPGNVLTVYYERVSSLPNPDPDLMVGIGVVISGVDVAGPNQNFNGQTVDGNYIVTSTGQGVPPGAQFGRWYFTVVMPSTQSVNQAAHISANAPFGDYQVTLATLKTTTPIPNTEVGSQITLAGVGIGSWDGTWTVLFTPNASQLAITQTSLLNNVATYSYNLITGTNPIVGQQVTITGCLNGPTVGGTSIFNVVNGIVSAIPGAGQFSIAITGPDTTAAAENGTAQVNGTIFQFDPGAGLVGSMTSPIFGNSGGGTVVVAGAGLGAGVRQAVVIFKTRSSYLTAPSLPVTFATLEGTTSLVFTNIPTGPPNVVARIIAITGANGANFFYIPDPVKIQNPGGQPVTYTSTVINDNTSTNAIFTFTDAVLLAASAIDIQGNNLFEQKELGPSLGCLAYGSRMVHWGELSKINQWVNPTFDGGSTQNSVGIPYPAGWTVDPVNGTGGIVVNSPLFGLSYYIKNSTGSEQNVLGLISQTAYQDYFGAPIILPNIGYGGRITVRSPSGATQGQLNVEFFSPSFNRIFGQIAIPSVSMTSQFKIFNFEFVELDISGNPTGNPMELSPIPTDLQLRLYWRNSFDTEDVEIDRIEVYPLKQPVLSTQLTVSYEDNFEAFDAVTGIIGTATQNQQANKAAFTLYDSLYIVKTGSLLSTQDNGTTEPNGWTVRTVSNSVGTFSANGVDFVDSNQQGESYALIGGRTGLYIFTGGEPILISSEIKSLWNTIVNWNKLWVRNDQTNRRIMVGACLPTPNQWMPNAPSNPNPSTSNVILMLSYRELNSVTDLEDRPTVRASSFTGKLIALDIARKWTIWQIRSPYGDFVTRADETTPFYLGNSLMNGALYKLVEGRTDDNGAAINETYTTYAFVKPDQEQGLQLGSVRKQYSYMTSLLTGNGSLGIKVFPDNLTGPFAHALIPITLPTTANGDTEIPLNETATRMFVQFSMNKAGENFALSRLVMAMKAESFAPVRGRN